MAESPATAWTAALADGGYDHACRSPGEFRKAKRLGQAWRRILRATGLRAPASAFEIGCGGGVHLATLAAHGFDVSGVGVSPQVADRARRYLGQVAGFADSDISVDITTGDFFAAGGIPPVDLV